MEQVVLQPGVGSATIQRAGKFNKIYRMKYTEGNKMKIYL